MMLDNFEYRVQTVGALDPDDRQASQDLTNISQASMPERESQNGWNIFAFLPGVGGKGWRLIMKRAKK